MPTQKQQTLDTEDELDIKSYDFRAENFVSAEAKKRMIKDQGNCGASWAFSTIDVLADRTAKVYNGTQGNHNEASVQMLISCIILPGNANGCSPAPVDTAWNYIQKLHTSSFLINSGYVILNWIQSH